DFANALTRMGVGPRQRVGIMSENRYEWVVCDLAVQQLGCVSVCFPVEEMAARPLSELADTYGLALLVTSARALFRRRPEHWVLNLDGVTTGVSARAVPPLDPEGVCSLAFSSGTAGRLKCLRMAARGAEATIELAARRWGLRSDDRTLIALPLSTFQQRLIVYASIWLGSTMILTDSPKLFAAIQEGAPTVVIGPPALYQVFEARFNALPAPVRAALRAAAAWARLLPLRVLRGRALKRLFRPFYAALGGAPRVLITASAPSADRWRREPSASLRTARCSSGPAFRRASVTSTTPLSRRAHSSRTAASLPAIWAASTTTAFSTSSAGSETRS